MNEKTISGILENMFVEIRPYIKKDVENATSELKKLFHDIIPDENGLCTGKDFDKLSDCEYALKTERNIGHDKAIKKINKAIDKL